MNEMIERVAAALLVHITGGNADEVWAALPEEAFAGRPRDSYRAMARAAIEAMRDPGRDFIWNAVYAIEPPLSCIMGHDLGDDEAEQVYQAVIDAALKQS